MPPKDDIATRRRLRLTYTAGVVLAIGALVVAIPAITVGSVSPKGAALGLVARLLFIPTGTVEHPSLLWLARVILFPAVGLILGSTVVRLLRNRRRRRIRRSGNPAVRT